MADEYWNRQQQRLPSSSLPKRSRIDYDTIVPGRPSGGEVHNYLAFNDNRAGARILKDTKTIGSSYELYLQNQISNISSREVNPYGGPGIGRTVDGGVSDLPIVDPSRVIRPADISPDRAANGQAARFTGQLPVDTLPRVSHENLPLPQDASSTLYVEGLPPDSRRREVAHIFRPFVGYKEVRLVSKESKHRGGDPLILCFVDFVNPACAATALSALQGYKMDEHDPDSNYLRLQFSRHPGPRSVSGSRGKR